MLNWVTRGVFLGYQRNYLELQVDDLFLGDDAWDPATHTTNYDPAAGEPHDAGRRRPGRGVVEGARRAPRLRLQRRRQRALQGQTSDDDRPAGQRRSPSPATRGAFGFINHTYDHPNLDCSTSSFITKADHRQRRRGRGQHGLPIDPTRGRHRRALRASPTPGPATPARSTRRASTTSTPAAGGDDPGRHLRLRAHRAARRPARRRRRSSPASPSPPASKVDRELQRRLPRGRLHPLPQPARAPTRGRSVGHARALGHGGRPTTATNPIELTLTDTRRRRHGRRAAGRQRRRARALRAEPELPRRASPPRASRYVASDASKAYPSNPTTSTARRCRRARRSPRARVQAVPRYPSNVYYNVSKPGPAARRVQLDLRRAGQRRRLRADRRASPRAARRRRRGPSTWRARTT